jgi:A/G-specific adenine glycosylase
MCSMTRSGAHPRIELDLAPLPDPAEIRWLHGSLCDWYHAFKRDLPWRRRSDAFAIWISESMLQQTRVETVIPYFERFMARFKDLAALAEGEEEEVLALWSGLGYYRRARALHAAAREIMEFHGGVFPRERGALLGLPGVGPYTAGAVLSMAFGASEALVDANVARVFARVFALEAPLRSPALEQALWRLAEALVPAEDGGSQDAQKGVDPGSWNQAVMELGATLCTPKSPRCQLCPLQERCEARARGRAEELPLPAPRRPLVAVELEMLLAQTGERTLLTRRPPGGRMAGMWELPTREIPNARGETHLWEADFLTSALPGGCTPIGEELSTLRHAITHHRITVSLRRATLDPSGAQVRARDGSTWRLAAGDDLASLALTGLTKKALRAVSGPAP